MKTPRTLFAISVATLAIAYGTACAAQSAPPASPSPDTETAGVQDIVITAQRRSENVQRSSLAIQVLSGDAVQKAGATQASDLGTLVPGLKVSATGSTVQLFIRGVGDITTNPLTSPAVTFNVDGVYVGRPSAIGPNFFDVARIEVLKGPQGTLYGRNASGGAVNLITQAPEIGVASGFVEGEVGNYDLKRLTGAVNAPLGDTLAVRAAFQVIDRDGYQSDGSSDQKSQAVRFRALWQPDDAVSVMLNFDAAHVGGKGEGFVLLPLVDRKNPWKSINSDQANRILTTYPFLPFPADVSRGVPFQDNEFINVSGQLDWKLGFATLTVIPAYRHTHEDFDTWSGFEYGQRNTAEQTSVEARLSNDGKKLKWVIGGFYYNEDQKVAAHAATNILFQNIQLNYRVTDRAYSAFGEATYSIVDRLRLIGGVRYTSEDNGLEGATTDASPLTGPRIAETYGPGGVSARKVTWKGGAEFDVADHNMIFASVATGFKAGGLNPSAAPNSFKPEKLTAYTIGSRNRFFDNMLQLNLEGFYWDYKNKQESAVGLTPAGNFTNLTRNAASATLKGGSADLVFAPSHADTLHLFGEYNDTKYKQFIVEIPGFLFNPLGISTGCGIGTGAPGFVRLDCSGKQLIRAPKWTGSAGYDHRFDLGGGASVTAGVQAQFSSAYWLSTNFTSVERAAGYATFDASLILKPAWNGVTITGYVKNIGDRPVYGGGNQLPLQAPLFAATLNAPRTYGVRIRFSF